MDAISNTLIKEKKIICNVYCLIMFNFFYILSFLPILQSVFKITQINVFIQK